MNLDDLNISRTKSFFNSYSHKRSLYCNINKKPRLKKKDERICRFCDKKTPEVTFKKEAHIIPQLLGNRYLISDFECDLCNSYFSQYEDSLANFLGPFRTFAFIRGKTGIPKFRDNLRIQEFFIEGNQVNMNVYGGDSIFVDEKKREIVIRSEINSFVPFEIYKLFLKMAFSVLTEAELNEYQETKKLLNRKYHSNIIHGNFDFAKIFFTFIPGPFGNFPSIHLYERKDENKLLPKHCLILYFSNHQIQYFLPGNSSDEKNLIGEKIEVPAFPLLIDKDILEEYGKAETKPIDFSKNETIQNEERKLSISFRGFRKYSDDEIEGLNKNLH